MGFSGYRNPERSFLVDRNLKKGQPLGVVVGWLQKSAYQLYVGCLEWDGSTSGRLHSYVTQSLGWSAEL